MSSDLNHKIKIFSPIVKIKKSHFIYEALFFCGLFTFIDLMGYYVGNRYGKTFPTFPFFFTYFGVVCGIIVLFTKKKSQIALYFYDKMLIYQYISFFNKTAERRVCLKDTKSDFSKFPSGRKSEWILTITKNEKKIFCEKENNAVFSKEILMEIFNELKMLEKESSEHEKTK